MEIFLPLVTHLITLLLSLIAVLLTLMVIWRTGKRLDHFFKYFLVALLFFAVANIIGVFVDIALLPSVLEEITEAISVLFIVVSVFYILHLIERVSGEQ